MIIIGVCGAPASGKSAVAAALHRLGAVWVNADAISHTVLADPEVVSQLVMRFGNAIVGADGKIDRPTLGQIVFGDDESAKTALRYLESVVHPETRRRMKEEIGRASDADAIAVVLDVPLLFESQWDRCCDEIWFVDTPRSQVVRAANERGWSVENLDKRISNQLSLDEKRRRATRVIDNSGSLEHLNETVKVLWDRLTEADQQESGIL